jgi:DNA-binding XRE family transcriptional regulator
VKYRDFLNERLKNPEFREVWNLGEGEYQAMRAVVLARDRAGITQKELSVLSQIPQKTISAIETGKTNPKVSTLAKIASSLGKELRIDFV